MRNMTVLFFMLLCVAPIDSTALEVGPGVATLDGEKLKWVDGPYGSHVMFKSLLANLNTGDDMNGGMYNPQADACLDQSTYTLNLTQLPVDAVIERAFLVWTAAQPTAKLADFTDNTVRLDFVHESEADLNNGVEVTGREARLNDAQDFSFESFQQSDESGNRGFFTHRVDVTDLFKQIQTAGRSSPGNSPVSDGTADGMSLYGNYTVSGLDCTSDAAYLDMSVMVANWSIILVYTSSMVPSRDIYLYHGFATYQRISMPWSLTGFTLPANPKMLLTLNTHEGDGGLINPAASAIPESLKLNGTGGDPVDLYNTCNYFTQANNEGTPFPYTEMFNSISSEYGLDPAKGETCIGGYPPNSIDISTMEYAIDMDTFYIDGTTETWAGQFPAGTDTLTVTLGANQDAFFTNFLILAVEDPDQWPNFDIPPEATNWPDGREKHYCGCPPENGYNYHDGTPLYYIIKIQNWGTYAVKDVRLVDDLYYCTLYINGSTEMASVFDETGNGLDWKAIPDLPDNGKMNSTYSLIEPGVQVADIMTPCDRTTGSCKDTRLVRFKVRLADGCPKGTWDLRNTAEISGKIKDSQLSKTYFTNGNSPLILRYKMDGTCSEPPKSECGGDVPDDDAITTDNSATDTATDADTATTLPKKVADDGCGCAVVF